MDEYILIGPVTLRVFSDDLPSKYTFRLSDAHMNLLEDYMEKGTEHQRECARSLFSEIVRRRDSLHITMYSWTKMMPNSFRISIGQCSERVRIFKNAELDDYVMAVISNNDDIGHIVKKRRTGEEVRTLLGSEFITYKNDRRPRAHSDPN